MKTDSNFRCGLQSSGKLHSPHIRRKNRLGLKDKAMLHAKKIQDKHEARMASLIAKNKQKDLTATMEKKQSRVGKFFKKVKEVLNTKVF